jgi:hypothetical protein
MSEEKITTESVDTTGSSEELIQTDPAQPNNVDSGESAGKTSNDSIPKGQYEELEKKLGAQGQELGEYRDFVKGITPLLDKLDASPTLVQAILDGKIDNGLAAKVLEGRLTEPEAETVQKKVIAEVKKEVGQKEYEKLDQNKIDQLVAEKLAGFEKKLDQKITEQDELHSFEERTNKFINSTEDFEEYSDKIAGWFESHPTQTDIEIAYHAVKGKEFADQTLKNKSQQSGEAAKNLAANAQGGSSKSSGLPEKGLLIDDLIKNKSNPNDLI